MDPNDTTTSNTGDPTADAQAGIDAAIDGTGAAPAADLNVADVLDKAIADADAGAPVQVPEPETPAVKPDPAAGKDKGDAAKDGQPAKDADKGAKPDPKAADAATAKATDGKDKPEPDAEAVAEAKQLGLKDKANERFVAMATEIKALAPLKAEMEKAGLKDPAELPKVIARAQAADDMISMVMETGASAEQYGMTLDYLGVVNKAIGGDAAAAEKAWEMWQSEGRELAKALGKEVPGLHDPLAEFPDLVAEVTAGDLTKARALEVAGQRRQASLAAQARTQSTQQGEASRAVETGKGALAQFDAQMLASDPSYPTKRDALSTMVKFIRDTLPPSQWVEATKRAYATLPNPAPAATAPADERKPAPGPMRPGGISQSLTPANFASPRDALDAALDDVAA